MNPITLNCVKHSHYSVCISYVLWVIKISYEELETLVIIFLSLDQNIILNISEH